MKTKKLSLHKTIERVNIMGLEWNASPLGLIIYAQNYLDAARILARPFVAGPEREPFTPVPPYLACHSLELALKAYLSLRGVRLLELSTFAYGHDLGLLLERAEEHGLASLAKLNDSQREAIQGAAPYYKQKIFEYPSLPEAVRGYSGAPNDLEPLLSAASMLCASLHQPCLDEANA